MGCLLDPLNRGALRGLIPFCFWLYNRPAFLILHSAKSSEVMQGLSIASLKRHPALMPLFAALGFGVGLSAFYTLRLATRNPDVTWRRTSNPEPWEEFRTAQYKFMNTANHDYTKSPAPKF